MRLIHGICGRRLVLPLVSLGVGIEFMRGGVGTFSVIEGTSMCPTLRPNDVVQARTLYGQSQRGDVVIITDNRNEQAIKRVIGLPGETVTLYRGFVYIDGQRLVEPYLAKSTYTFKSSTENERAIRWRLEANQYFLMGDNRFESCDSRHYGPVERTRINRIVKLPENSRRPGFCELMLSETGEAVVVKPGHGPTPNRPRQNHPTLNAGI
jgi:signal peptidase I